jgi:hypothetical protein
MSRNVEVIPTRIPIIDCSGIFGPLEQIENDDSFKEFTEKLGDFMSGVGFVYFINHGVKPSTVGLLFHGTLHETKSDSNSHPFARIRSKQLWKNLRSSSYCRKKLRKSTRKRIHWRTLMDSMEWTMRCERLYLYLLDY